MSALKLRPKNKRSPIVLTIGHSTRTLEEFMGLLEKHVVSRIVDVRTVPLAHRRCLVGSWNPHGGHHELNAETSSLTPFAKVRGHAITYPAEVLGAGRPR
jgi:hypothetical protein